MLIRISKHKVRLLRHVGALPDDGKILSKLCSLTDERFQEMIDDGANFLDGKIGELDLDTYQEYGSTMQGIATGPTVYDDRQRIFHRRFELDIEAGVGLTSGQGSDPEVWLDWSDDGGHQFSARKPTDHRRSTLRSTMC